MAKDYIKLINDQLGDARHTRMKEDRALFELDDYILKDANNKKLDNVINVTLGFPLRLTTFIESALGNSEEEIVVTSEDKKVDAAYIEDFLRSSAKAASAMEVKKGNYELNPYFDQQFCRLGGAAARCVWHKNKEGIPVLDMSPWDTQFVAKGRGINGLGWIGYRMMKDADQIVGEWPEAEKVVGGAKEAEVSEVWDETENIIYVAGKDIIHLPNPYGSVPAAYQEVPLGSMSSAKESQKYRGESVLLLIRKSVAEMNRLVSIMQTLNILSMRPPGTFGTKDGVPGLPAYADVFGIGALSASESGGGPRIVTFGDALRAAYLVKEMIEKELREGGLTEVDIGDPQFEFSAIALLEIGKARDQIHRPRLRSKASLNLALAIINLNQVQSLGVSSVLVGTPGHEREFDVSRLQGEYEIEYKYYVRSPATDIALLSFANSAQVWMPKKYVYENVLQVRNPAKVMRDKLIDEAVASSYLLTMKERWQALIDDDRKEDAAILLNEVGLTVDQMLAGQTPSTSSLREASGQAGQVPQPGQGKQEAGKPKPEELLSLLGQGGGKGRPNPSTGLRAGSAQAGANLKKMPKEEVNA